MKKYFRLIMMLVMVFTSPKISPAQKTITFQELMRRMIGSTDSEIIFQNLVVTNRNSYDARSMFGADLEPDTSLMYRFADSASFHTIKSKVTFRQVSFEGDAYLFAHLQFNQPVTFENCVWKNYSYFIRCRFEGLVQVKKCSFYICEWVGTKFMKGISLTHMDEFQSCFADVDCYGSFGYNTDHAPFFLNIKDSRFFIATDFFVTSNDPNGKLKITGCAFNAIEQVGGFAIWNSSQFYSLIIENCVINLRCFLSYAEVSSSLSLKHNQFKRGVSMYAFDFPETSASMDWKQFSDFSVGIHDDKFNIVTGRTEEELMAPDVFQDLGKIYAKLLRTFKNNGDQKSYNDCYISWKDIETRKLQLDYEKDHTLSSLFNIRLNQFLKTFCEYGTNPTRSLVYSFYVVLLFGLIFFFFPFEYDNLHKVKWVKKMNQLLDYFSSNKRLPEFHDEEMKQKLEALNQLHVRINQSYQSVPVVIKIFGLPYYWAANLYYHFRIGVLKRLDYSPQVWAQISGWKRVKGNALAFFDLLLFVLWGIIHRAINAITLSLNSFVTLGIGNVVPNGLAKYFAVAEGAMGWFLLSIFSVSLISQLLG